jgi:hypothetical protein
VAAGLDGDAVVAALVEEEYCNKAASPSKSHLPLSLSIGQGARFLEFSMLTFVPVAFYETLCVNRSAINCLSTSPFFQSHSMWSLSLLSKSKTVVYLFSPPQLPTPKGGCRGSFPPCQRRCQLRRKWRTPSCHGCKRCCQLLGRRAGRLELCRRRREHFPWDDRCPHCA